MNVNTILRLVALTIGLAAQNTLTAAVPTLNDINPATGETALTEACSAYNPWTIAYLIALGADTNAKNARELTPLMIACHNNNLITVHLLLQNPMTNVQITTKANLTALHILCGNKTKDVDTQLQIATLLLERGADVNARTETLKTPFMAACTFGSKRLQILLRNYGADTTAQDTCGSDALDAALKREDDHFTSLPL